MTTFSCLLGAVWPADRRAVVAECDPSGGDLAIRFGLSANQGMTSLVLSRRHALSASEGVEDHLQRLPGGLEVAIGPIGADSATHLDGEIAALTTQLFPEEFDALVDCGRLGFSAVGQLRTIAEADHVLLLTLGDAAALAHARWALDKLAALDDRMKPLLLLVGASPFSTAEIAAVIGHDITDVIPNDQKSAFIASGGIGKKRVLARSPLVAMAKRVANEISSTSSLRAAPLQQPEDGQGVLEDHTGRSPQPMRMSHIRAGRRGNRDVKASRR